jgi:glycosyltransferase involved in cell wall biosynthesis
MVAAFWRARRLYRLLPAGLRRRARRMLLRLTGTRQSERVGDPPPRSILAAYRPRPDPALPPGALLLGFARAEMGLGQALRGLATGLAEAAVPVRLHDLGAQAARHRHGDRSLAHLIDQQAEAQAQIYCVTAEQLPGAISGFGLAGAARGYRIAYPFWELPALPARWARHFDEVDEIWAPSRFVAGSLAAGCARPLHLIGTAVLPPAPAPLRRADFGIPDDAFAFLFFFDPASFASRKNPVGALRAFHLAFPPGDPTPVALVFKSLPTGPTDKATTELRALAAADPRVVLIERSLGPGEQAALQAVTDAFVSLHRSEGFGLGLAEAMLLGKPVVATAYGGCMDFLGAETACLVDYRLVPLGPGEYPQGEGQVWADPDLGQAAQHLRRLVTDGGFARRLGARGQAEIRANHSPAAVGRRAAERLRVLRLIP